MTAGGADGKLLQFGCTDVNIPEATGDEPVETEAEDAEARLRSLREEL
jgi:hypothetical protein